MLKNVCTLWEENEKVETVHFVLSRGEDLFVINIFR